MKTVTASSSLQQVGLDEYEVKRTINRQVRTVFFLPLIFAFIHLAFAYHMIRLILKVLWCHQ